MNTKSKVNVVEAMKMRENGKTFQKIADVYGTSRQYIQQTICRESAKRGIDVERMRKSNTVLKNIKYQGLRKFFESNDMAFSTLARKSHIEPLTFSNFLSGCNGKKFTVQQIKNLCEITNMSFEELFGEVIV